MNVILMKKLIAAMDESNIPESFTVGKTIESDADIDKLVNDYQALKLSVMDQEDTQAIADIDSWSKPDEAKTKAEADISGWEPK